MVCNGQYNTFVCEESFRWLNNTAGPMDVPLNDSQEGKIFDACFNIFILGPNIVSMKICPITTPLRPTSARPLARWPQWCNTRARLHEKAEQYVLVLNEVAFLYLFYVTHINKLINKLINNPSLIGTTLHALHP